MTADARITKFHEYLKAKSEAFDAGWNDYTTLLEFERLFDLPTTSLFPINNQNTIKRDQE